MINGEPRESRTKILSDVLAQFLEVSSRDQYLAFGQGIRISARMVLDVEDIPANAQIDGIRTREGDNVNGTYEVVNVRYDRRGHSVVVDLESLT